MEDRFVQQLKKGALEMLVLEMICRKPAYGYELLTAIREQSQELFVLKEGTLYPILYRLEDDGLIASSWSQGQGSAAPKKIYSATETGAAERLRRRDVWKDFCAAVDRFHMEDDEK